MYGPESPTAWYFNGDKLQWTTRCTRKQVIDLSTLPTFSLSYSNHYSYYNMFCSLWRSALAYHNTGGLEGVTARRNIGISASSTTSRSTTKTSSSPYRLVFIAFYTHIRRSNKISNSCKAYWKIYNIVTFPGVMVICVTLALLHPTTTPLVICHRTSEDLILHFIGIEKVR